MDSNHEEFNKMLGWAGGDFYPAHFNTDTVYFDDPHGRYEYAFS
jgi:hypothetical protein